MENENLMNPNLLNEMAEMLAVNNDFPYDLYNECQEESKKLYNVLKKVIE